MGWLGRKRKPQEEEGEDQSHEPLRPLPPVLNILVPDTAAATSFHLRQFYSAEEARDYIQTLVSTAGLHGFWGLHEPPAGNTSGEGTGEAMVLIRSAEDSGTVYVVSFVDLDSANAFARFETKRGLGLGLLLIYWAELVNVEIGESGVRLTPEAPPSPARRALADRFGDATAAAPVVAAEAPAVSERETPPGTQPVTAAPEPEPVAQVEAEIAAVEPEPVAYVEPEVAAPEPEPVAPVAYVEPEVAEPEPVAQVEAEIAAVEPELVTDVEPEVTAVEPELVAYVEPEVAAPEPEPVAYVEPEVVAPERVPEVHPDADTGETGRSFQVQFKVAGREPESFGEQDSRRVPEPVAREEGQSTETSPDLFTPDDGGHGKEMDIEREAIAFLRASANGNEAAPEVESLLPSEAEAAEALEVTYGEPAPVGSGAPTQTRSEESADATSWVRGWDSPPPGEENGAEEECSEELVQEVEKILRVKRWDKKDSPFRGFDSPPGRF